MTRSLRSLVVLAGASVLLLAACVHTPVVITPSLAPVDATRPIVRYQPIQGTACNPILFHGIPLGNNSLLEALWDMKRLVGVDGYVEVSVEEKTIHWVVGHTRCTIVTAYPFTYGTEPKPISVRGRAPMPGPMAAPAPAAAPVAAPTRAPAPAPARRRRSAPTPTYTPPAPAPARTLDRATCEPACRAFGRHAGATALIQRVVADRCISRCVTGDQGYFDCVSDTRDVTDVKRCNAK